MEERCEDEDGLTLGVRVQANKFWQSYQYLLYQFDICLCSLFKMLLQILSAYLYTFPFLKESDKKF